MGRLQMGGGSAGKGPDVKLPGALLGSGPCLQLILFLFWQSFELQSLDNNVNTMHPGKMSYFRAVDVDPNQTGTTDLTLYYPHVSGGGTVFSTDTSFRRRVSETAGLMTDYIYIPISLWQFNMHSLIPT